MSVALRHQQTPSAAPDGWRSSSLRSHRSESSCRIEDTTIRRQHGGILLHEMGFNGHGGQIVAVLAVTG